MVSSKRHSAAQTRGAKRRQNTVATTDELERNKQLRTDRQHSPSNSGNDSDTSKNNEQEPQPQPPSGSHVASALAAAAPAPAHTETISEITTTLSGSRSPEQRIVDTVVRKRVFPKVKFTHLHSRDLEYWDKKKPFVALY